MAKKVKMSIKKEGGSESFVVEGTLTEEDIELFSEYIKYSEELIASKYFKEDRQASINIKYKEDSGTKITAYLPPDEICDSMIFRMRPFVLKRERTSFDNICGRIRMIFSDDIIGLMLRIQQDLWNGKHYRSMVKVQDNDGILNSDNTIMDYLNAFEYHRDKQKQERLEWPKQFLGDKGLRTFFMIFILEKAKAVMNISAFCKLILRQLDEITISSD